MIRFLWKRRVARIIGEIAFKYGLSVRWAGDVCFIERLGLTVLVGFLSGKFKWRLELSTSLHERTWCHLRELDYKIMDALRREDFKAKG